MACVHDWLEATDGFQMVFAKRSGNIAMVIIAGGIGLHVTQLPHRIHRFPWAPRRSHGYGSRQISPDSRTLLSLGIISMVTIFCVSVIALNESVCMCTHFHVLHLVKILPESYCSVATVCLLHYCSQAHRVSKHLFGWSKIKSPLCERLSHRNCSLSSQRFSEVRSSKVHCRCVAVVPFRSSVPRALAQAEDKVCYTLP